MNRSLKGEIRCSRRVSISCLTCELYKATDLLRDTGLVDQVEPGSHLWHDAILNIPQLGYGL